MYNNFFFNHETNFFETEHFRCYNIRSKKIV